MTEITPGQRAYETWLAAMDQQGVNCDDWDDVTPEDQHAWVAVEAAERDALEQLAAGWLEFADGDGGARDWTPGTTGLPEALLGRSDGFRECAKQLLAAVRGT